MKNISDIIHFRSAKKNDLPTIVQMLADDPLGAKRENYQNPLPKEYLKTFEAIEKDENNEIVLACHNKKIVGFLQITFIPYLTYTGKWRALVEGVRVEKSFRNQGIGKRLIFEAIEKAKQKKCHLIQLTTDKSRPEAISFYNSLGFVASHEGMKLHL